MRARPSCLIGVAMHEVFTREEALLAVGETKVELAMPGWSANSWTKSMQAKRSCFRQFLSSNKRYDGTLEVMLTIENQMPNGLCAGDLCETQEDIKLRY